MLILLELNHIHADFTDDDIVRIGLALADEQMAYGQLLRFILERTR